MDTHREIQPEEMEEGSLQHSERSAVTPTTPGDDRASSDNRTPLHMAAWTADVEGVRRILETLQGRSVEDAQAVVNAQDRFGFTPLHLAVHPRRRAKWMLAEGVEGSVGTRKDREEVVRILTTSSWMLPDRYITAASEKDEKDGRYTPLHMAARAGSIAIVKLLLRQPLCRGDYKGCDPIDLRATTWAGHTPLAMAYKYQNFDVAELLKYSDLSWLESEKAKLASSINAIMVGATLIAAATFGAWRLPPLGISNPASDEVAHNFKWRSRASMACYGYIWHAFLFSVVALLLSILTTTTTYNTHLKAEVKGLRKTVVRLSCLLYLALFFFSWASQLFAVLVLDATFTSAQINPQILNLLKYSVTSGLIIISYLMVYPVVWLSDETEDFMARNQVYAKGGFIFMMVMVFIQVYNFSLIAKIFNLKV